MARPIRIEYPGAVYHVTAHGSERRKIVRDDEDRRLFLTTLGETVRDHGLRLHGYCLTSNHYHLLVETPRGNLTRAIGWLQTTFTIRSNTRHRRGGRLFPGRFKAHLVDAELYGKELLRYIHLNPVRPRQKTSPIPGGDKKTLADYRWSSHRAYLGRERPPEWLSTEWLRFFAARRDKALREYALFVEQAFGQILETPWGRPRFGLVLGGPALVERVRKLLAAKPRRKASRRAARAAGGDAFRAAAGALAREEKDWRWQIWIRIRLGGERRVDVAREYGYSDGSAVTHILTRLEGAAHSNPAVGKRLSALRAAHYKRSASVRT
jgi:putative transposase